MTSEAAGPDLPGDVRRAAASFAAAMPLPRAPAPAPIDFGTSGFEAADPALWANATGLAAQPLR